MRKALCLIAAALAFLTASCLWKKPVETMPKISNRIGMEFVFVKGGCFKMGDSSGDGEPDERPPHKVCIGDFYMGQTEVTQGQWKTVMSNNPSYFPLGDLYPVERVSWEGVQEFILKLGEKTGLKYRLPTEAEWEYSARSRGKKEKWAGVNEEAGLKDYAWYKENSEGITHPVCRKKPNALGLCDMSGNVWEWVSDWYDKDYYSVSPKGEQDPKGPETGTGHVLRGGSWNNMATDLRTINRHRESQWFRTSNGFRLVIVGE